MYGYGDKFFKVGESVMVVPSRLHDYWLWTDYVSGHHIYIPVPVTLVLRLDSSFSTTIASNQNTILFASCILGLVLDAHASFHFFLNNDRA
jgi:hypothetical protein